MVVSKPSLISFAAAAMVSASTVHAQEVDFSRIPGVDAEPTVQIDLRAGMLSFVSAMAGATDPSLAEALGGLERVRVFVYSAVEDRDALAAFLEDSARQLERGGYERTVMAEEGTSKVRVHTKIGDTRLEGITLMVLEGEKEAVFIDVAGDIDPAQLGRAMAKLGVSAGIDQMRGVMNGLPSATPGPHEAVPATPPRAQAAGAAAPVPVRRPSTPTPPR
jgi:hypothetical protein